MAVKPLDSSGIIHRSAYCWSERLEAPLPEIQIPETHWNTHFLFTLTGDPEPMSFAIGAQIDITGADAQTYSDDAYVAFSGGYGAPNWYAQWTFLGVRVEAQDGFVAETLIPLVGTGGSLGTVTQNVSVLVKKITGLPGRKNHGRCYFPPISLAEADVNNVGIISATPLSVIQTNWNGFISALEGSGEISRLDLLHSGSDDPTEITSFQVEQQVATQRRRLR